MPGRGTDAEIDLVRDVIRNGSPGGRRWARVIRKTYDMIYDGRETGRYQWSDLHKTEKTHFGTVFEINAQREFNFDGGHVLDFSIEGIEVDAKWSQSGGGWMLPPESFDRLVLLATASDVKGVWSLGLVRVSHQNRRMTTNRDAKTQLSAAGRAAVDWIWQDFPLPPNVLLQLDEKVVNHIFDAKSGTQRTHRLFREAEGLIVHRGAVETTSQQLDTQKRVRGNGGSRSALAPEGFVILSGEYHAHLAQKLGVAVPSRGEYISVRVVPSDDPKDALIDGSRWRRAGPNEQVTVPAPRLPDRGIREE